MDDGEKIIWFSVNYNLRILWRMLQALEPGNCMKMVVRSALICLCRLISAQFSEGELILCGMQSREKRVTYSPTRSGLESGCCVRCVSYHVSSCHISFSNCVFWHYAGWIGFRLQLTVTDHHFTWSAQMHFRLRLSEYAHTRDLANDGRGGNRPPWVL